MINFFNRKMKKLKEVPAKAFQRLDEKFNFLFKISSSEIPVSGI
jgi:hypothetical protein